MNAPSPKPNRRHNRSAKSPSQKTQPPKPEEQLSEQLKELRLPMFREHFQKRGGEDGRGDAPQRRFRENPLKFLWGLIAMIIGLIHRRFAA